eukprot:Em0011g312a
MRKLTVPPIGHYSGRESYRPHHSTVSLPFPLMGCVDTITISCSDSMPQREVGTSDACTPPQSHSRYSRHSSSDSSSGRTITLTSPLNKTRASGRPYGTLDQLDYLLAWRGREKHPQCGAQTGNSSMQRSQLHKQMAVSTPRAKCSAETDPTMASDSVRQIETCYTNGLQKPVNPPPPMPTLAALSEREESTAQMPPYIPRVVTKASVSSSDPVVASESQDFPSSEVGCAGDATQQSDSRDGERGHSVQASLENEDLFVGMLVTQPPTNLLDAHHSPLLPPEDWVPSDDSMQHRDTTLGTKPSKRHSEVNLTAEEGNIPRVVTKASVSSSDPVVASESQDSPSSKVGCAGDATQQSDSQDGERGHSVQASLENKDLFVGMLVTQPPTNLLDAHHSPLLPPKDWVPSDDSMQHRDTTLGTKPSKRHSEVNLTAQGGNASVKPAAGTHPSSNPLLDSAKDVYAASCGERVFPLAKDGASSSTENDSRANPVFHDHNPADSDPTAPTSSDPTAPTSNDPTAPTSRKVFHKAPYSPAMDGGVSATTTAKPARCDEASEANAANIKSYMDDLKNMKQECEELNAVRTKMGLKIRHLQSLLQRKREEGEERWKKNFFAEKKRFVVLEDKMKELRGSLRALQKAAEEESLRRVSNILIQSRRLKAFIERLQERLSSVKENVFKEQQVNSWCTCTAPKLTTRFTDHHKGASDTPVGVQSA